ncbi:hypothetical protein [uncultured Sulfitobacter sp.]|uniref:hypothetical protein n=1 Tax=uncultured Sulfitobacter sp. TaxID=191468 RepID=UPI00262E028D|nr:hypothetical protein [uncultured Sulfitobacter sp.]
MITPDTIATVRMIAFALAGLMCGGYALAALWGIPSQNLPHFLPLGAGIIAAIAFALAALIVGPQNTNAALDESYHTDRRTAASTGFWAAIVIGTTLWLTSTGGTLQLAITLTGASAVFLLTHALLDFRGSR